MTKKFGSILLIILILIFAYIGYSYINFRQKNAISDAAFIKSDSLMTLSFKISGNLIKTTKIEGESIKKGEVLAILDKSDLELEKKALIFKINSLKNKLNSLILKKEELQNELTLKLKITSNEKEKLLNKINSLNFEINSYNVNLNKLRLDEQKINKLHLRKLLEKEKLLDIQTKANSLNFKIKAKKQNIEILKIEIKNIENNLKIIKNKFKLVNELKEEINSLKNQINSFLAKLDLIDKKISYTKLISPIDAVIAKKYVNDNSNIKAGTPIYTIVNPKKLHLEVLLSERKLDGIKIGNKVEIKVDAFKNKTYYGVVESILPASASTFSLVPRDIASGEFTKLDQRFIVRIKIDNIDNNLKVGMGASVIIEKNKNN